MIQVQGLTKMYASHIAVNNLSFEVEEGQIYGLLGPNGAGKTTTMNIMTGYLAATEGAVYINGHDIFKEAGAAKREIGYLPEIPPLYTDLTVEEYLRFAGELKGLKAQALKEEVARVVQVTGCADMKSRLIKNLSKGYRQRVGIAQALLGDPKLIILDEPTVGLDPKQIVEIRDLILELGKTHTVILSSHILADVAAVCDKVLIISRGNLVALGTPAELSKMMHRKNQITLTVKGSEAEIRAALASIEGALSFAPASEEGLCEVVVETAEGSDPREQVFYALAARQCPIYAMQASRASLEDIFLELTREDAVQTADGQKEV